MFSPFPGESFRQKFQNTMFYAVNSLMIKFQFMGPFIPHGSLRNSKLCMRNSKSCSFESDIHRHSVTYVVCLWVVLISILIHPSLKNQILITHTVKL
jgi:hypothetical protein